MAERENEARPLPRWIRDLGELLADTGLVAMATVVSATGSAPQQAGARLLLCQDGRSRGTVGGGAVEAMVLKGLCSCLLSGTATLLSFDLVRDLGMCCGGRMEVLVERIETPNRLLLLGAGHVAKATADLARTVGFSPVVIDERADWNSEENFPGCERHPAPPIEVLETLPAHPGDWIVIMTHDHRLDEALLERCLARPHRYLGMIGSKRKVFQTLQRIASRRELPDLSTLHAPIGAPLGAVGPEEIAISIVSELLGIRRGSSLPTLSIASSPRLEQVLDGALSATDAAKLP